MGTGPIWWLAFLLRIFGGTAEPVTVAASDQDTSLLSSATTPDGTRTAALWCRELHGPISRCYSAILDGEREPTPGTVFEAPLPDAPGQQARIFSVHGDIAWLSESVLLIAAGRYVRYPKSQEILAQFLRADGVPSSAPIVIATEVVDELQSDIHIAPDEDGGAWIYWTSAERLFRRRLGEDGSLASPAEIVSTSLARRGGPSIAGRALLYIEDHGRESVILLRPNAAVEDLGPPVAVAGSATPFGAFGAARSHDGRLHVLWTRQQTDCSLEGIAIGGPRESKWRLDVCPRQWWLTDGAEPLVVWVDPRRLVLAQALTETASPFLVGDAHERGDGMHVLRANALAAGSFEVLWGQHSRIVSRRVH